MCIVQSVYTGCAVLLFNWNYWIISPVIQSFNKASDYRYQPLNHLWSTHIFFNFRYFHQKFGETVKIFVFQFSNQHQSQHEFVVPLIFQYVLLVFFSLQKKTEWFWIIEWQTLSEWNQWKLQQFFCHEMLSKSWQWNRHNGSCLMRRSDISIAVLWHRMNKYLLK